MSAPECACHYWSLYDLGAGDAAARRENERLRAHVERLVDEIWGRDR